MWSYLIHILSLGAIYVVLALAYAVPLGYAGVFNLGHVGLIAVGAYVSALMTESGISFWLALPAAVAAGALGGFLLSLPARRLKGDYYALVTLGFMFFTSAILLNWIPLTHGPFGVTGIVRPNGFAQPEIFLLLVAVFAVLVLLFVRRITHSPFGRALEAVRDDELAAESLGKPAGKLKSVALVISGALAGLGGALLAHFIQFINPQLFWLDMLVWLTAALVLGGLASVRGTVLGVIILFAIFEPLRFLPLPPDLLGALRLIIFSLLLLGLMLFRPKGIWGRAQLEN